MGPLCIEGKLMLHTALKLTHKYKKIISLVALGPQDGKLSLFVSARRFAVFPSDPPVPDFSDTPINVTIPAGVTGFQIQQFFIINDDNIDEDEQSFAIVAEIGPDVPENISCFQTAVGEKDCFGRRGATEIRITDNDRKFLHV